MIVYDDRDEYNDKNKEEDSVKDGKKLSTFIQMDFTWVNEPRSQCNVFKVNASHAYIYLAKIYILFNTLILLFCLNICII